MPRTHRSGRRASEREAGERWPYFASIVPTGQLFSGGGTGGSGEQLEDGPSPSMLGPCWLRLELGWCRIPRRSVRS